MLKTPSHPELVEAIKAHADARGYIGAALADYDAASTKLGLAAWALGDPAVQAAVAAALQARRDVGTDLEAMDAHAAELMQLAQGYIAYVGAPVLSPVTVAPLAPITLPHDGNVDVPPVDPGIPAVFGCRVPKADLIDWSVQLVDGGGKPASIPLYGSGAGPMERFWFRSDQKDMYGGPNGWGSSGYPKPQVARDFIVGSPGYSKWGSNVDGVREEVVEYMTLEGILPAPSGTEHGCYRKRQGGGDTTKPSIVRRGCLYRNTAGAAIQLGHRDFWIHGGPFGPGAASPKQECADPATCFDDTGPVLIVGNRFERCSAAFDAATLSLHAPQKWSAGAKMPRACSDLAIEGNHFDNRSTVQPQDLLYNTPIFAAGYKSIAVRGNTIERRSGIRTSTSVLRPLMQFGDPYHPGTTWGLPYAPAVEKGGNLTVEGNKLWSDEPCSVHLWLEPGAHLKWIGNMLLPGSASITVLLNGKPLGSATDALII